MFILNHYYLREHFIYSVPKEMDCNLRFCVLSHFVRMDILKIIFEARKGLRSFRAGTAMGRYPWAAVSLSQNPGLGLALLSHSRGKRCCIKQTLKVIGFAENNYRVKFKT